jgi:hypothetical protein
MTAASSLSDVTAATEKEQIQDMDYALLEAKATRMAEEGGHYMLVILQGNPWQQLQAFMRTLRGPQFPFQIPVLVMAASTPPREVGHEIFQAQPRVGLKKLGGTATVMELMEMGLEHARCVMLLGGNAGQVSTHDRRMIDGTGVTMVSTIEWEISERGIPGIPIMLELHQQESLKYLHRFPLYEPNWTHIRSSCRTKNLECHDPKMLDNQGNGGKATKVDSFINHPRFASGDIFTASCLGALVARAYYTPGIVNFWKHWFWAFTLARAAAHGRCIFRRPCKAEHMAVSSRLYSMILGMLYVSACTASAFQTKA